MCISVLCVLLNAQIEGEFSLYLVRLMISFKFMCVVSHLGEHKMRMNGSIEKKMSFSWSFEEDKFLFEMSSLSKSKMKIHDYNGDHVVYNKGVSLHELLYYICVSRLLHASVCMYMQYLKSHHKVALVVTIKESLDIWLIPLVVMS